MFAVLIMLSLALVGASIPPPARETFEDGLRKALIAHEQMASREEIIELNENVKYLIALLQQLNLRGESDEGKVKEKRIHSMSKIYAELARRFHGRIPPNLFANLISQFR